MLPYLLIGMCAFALTFVATPVVRWAADRLGFIDRPSDRKVHATPTPTLGGAAIFLGMVGAGLLARLLPDFEEVFTQSSEVLGILLGATVIFLLGVVDDLREVPAPVKIAGQIFASGIVFLAGVKTQYLFLPSEVFSLSDDVSVLVTVAWLVAMTNAVNLIDGLDGLCAGIVAIAASTFFVYVAQLNGQNLLGAGAAAPLVAIIIVGAALGFLRHNFHPAKIFMGDSGSMVLGFVLGATTVSGVGNIGVAPLTGSFLFYLPLMIPLAVLALPIADAILAVIRRARRRTSIFHADKEHIHHRLMDLGHGHRKTVLVMYTWSALAGGAALAFSFLDRGDVIFSLPIAVGAIVLYTLFPLLTKRRMPL